MSLNGFNPWAQNSSNKTTLEEALRLRSSLE